MWWLRKPKIISDVENNQACQAAKEFVIRLYNEDARIDVSLSLFNYFFLKLEKKFIQVYQMYLLIL